MPDEESAARSRTLPVTTVTTVALASSLSTMNVVPTSWIRAEPTRTANGLTASWRTSKYASPCSSTAREPEPNPGGTVRRLSGPRMTRDPSESVIESRLPTVVEKVCDATVVTDPAGDPAWRRDPWDHLGEGAVIRHVVVPFAGLASVLPPVLGIAINPGSGTGLRVHPDAVAELRLSFG